MTRAHKSLEYVGLGEQRYRNRFILNGNETATKLACAIIHEELIIADSHQMA